MREVLVGFDSAWANSPKRPGAIAALVLDGSATVFHKPRLATFEQASSFINETASEADYLLVAIDQPTVVPNHEGARPVDRVASSLISRLGGGVQPARRGGLAMPLFGDGAPIWTFLARLGAMQDPVGARGATAGRFVMEVFPAMALPAIVPILWHRKRAAKYNPAAARFMPSDWPLVALGMAGFADRLGAQPLADWLADEAVRAKPRKMNQDRLDAAICLAIALAWRHGPAESTFQIGDARLGLIATIVSPETRVVLAAASLARGVDFVSARDPLCLEPVEV